MNEFRIIHEPSRKMAIDAILDLKFEDEKVVKILKSDSKTARQRRYYWLLLRTIIASGKGDADTPEELDVRNKYRFRQTWFQDDEFLSDLFAMWVISHPNDVHWFCEYHLHTEALNTKEMSEYLDSILTYYGSDIDLPHPEDMGLLDY